jgi:hypothetical protein
MAIGRPKGSKNKLGAEVKRQIATCFERMGGLEKFVAWAGDHQSEFYRLYAALAPKETENEHTFNRSAEDLRDDELADIATGSRAGASEAASSAQEPPEFH